MKKYFISFGNGIFTKRVQLLKRQAINTGWFDKVIIELDNRYYEKSKLVIHKEGNGLINQIKVGDKSSNHFFVDHTELVKSNNFKIILK